MSNLTDQVYPINGHMQVDTWMGGSGWTDALPWAAAASPHCGGKLELMDPEVHVDSPDETGRAPWGATGPTR